MQFLIFFPDMRRDDDDDDWDDDNHESYDPSKKAQNMNILPQGLTPAQRRDYRMARRQGDLPEFMKTEEEEVAKPNKKSQAKKNESKPLPVGAAPKAKKNDQKANKNVPNLALDDWTPPPIDDQFKKLTVADEDGFVKVKSKGKGRGGKTNGRGRGK